LKPLQSLPLNIVGMEVPKYTVRLGRFHIQSLGTSIGLRLESWSANTCKNRIFMIVPPEMDTHALKMQKGTE
jgi:hypothetical protein